MERKNYVLVDGDGKPVAQAGPAPFDGETIEEAEAEARDTLVFRPGWHLVRETPELAAALRAMADAD